MDKGYLSPSTVKYLGDMESFSHLVMARALGLLEVKSGDMDKPDEYIVRVEAPGSGEAIVSLGYCHELGSVIGKYLAPGNSAVKDAVRDRLRSHLEGWKREAGIEGVVAELRSAAGDVRIPEVGVGNDDLRLAIQGAIYNFVRTMELNQRRRAPRELFV